MLAVVVCQRRAQLPESLQRYLVPICPAPVTSSPWYGHSSWLTSHTLWRCMPSGGRCSSSRHLDSCTCNMAGIQHLPLAAHCASTSVSGAHRRQHHASIPDHDSGHALASELVPSLGQLPAEVQATRQACICLGDACQLEQLTRVLL